MTDGRDTDPNDGKTEAVNDISFNLGAGFVVAFHKPRCPLTHFSHIKPAYNFADRRDISLLALSVCCKSRDGSFRLLILGADRIKIHIL